MSEQNTKEITVLYSSGFISDKTHKDYHKTFTSIFSAYTTSTLKILLQTN